MYSDSKKTLRLKDGGEAFKRFVGRQPVLHMQDATPQQLSGAMPAPAPTDWRSVQNAKNAATAASSITAPGNSFAKTARPATPAPTAPAPFSGADVKFLQTALPTAPVAMSSGFSNPTDFRLDKGKQASPGMAPNPPVSASSTIAGTPLVGAPGSSTDIQWDPATRTMSNAGGRAIQPMASPLHMDSAQNQAAKASVLARTPDFRDPYTDAAAQRPSGIESINPGLSPRRYLGMADGGAAPTSLRGLFQGAQRLLAPKPKLSATEAWDAAHPPAAPAAPAPVVPASAPSSAGLRGYVSNPALARREAAAGLNAGGTVPGAHNYVDGHGGEVPGNPHKGDVFNAKYTGGEFVASNAMLNKFPGLRENLQDMREQTLHAKGKTVAEADAGAVKGGTLRAAGGGMMDPEFWKRMPDLNLEAPPQAPGRALVPVAGSTAQQVPSSSRALVPVPGTGDNGYRPNFTAGDPAIGRAQEESLRAARQGAFRGGEPSGTGINAHLIPEVPKGGNSLADTFMRTGGRMGEMSNAAFAVGKQTIPESFKAAGRTVPTGLSGAALKGAAAGLRWLPMAGTAAGLGMEGKDIYDVARNGGTPLDIGAQAGGAVGRLGAAGLGAAAAAPLGLVGGPFAPVTVPLAAGLGGAAGYFLGDQAIRGLRQGVHKLTGLGDAEGRDPEEIRMANLPPKQPADHPVQVGVPTQAAQPQAQAPARPDAPIQIGGGGSGFVAAPQASDASQGLREVETPVVRHSGNDWRTANNLRNLEVSASSITNRPGYGYGGRAGVAPAVQAYLEAQKHDIALQGGNTAIENAGVKAKSDALQSDNLTKASAARDRTTLRGHEIEADGKLRAAYAPLQQAEAQRQRVGAYLQAAGRGGLEGAIQLATSHGDLVSAKSLTDQLQAGRTLENTAFEQSASADKARNEALKSRFVYPEGHAEAGKPDAQRISLFNRTADATVQSVAKQWANSNDPAKREQAAAMRAGGTRAVSPQLQQDMERWLEIKVITDQSRHWNPFASSGTSNNDLSGYQPLGYVDSLQDRIKLVNGMEVPVSKLQSGPNAPAFFNFGNKDNSLIPADLPGKN